VVAGKASSLDYSSSTKIGVSRHRPVIAVQPTTVLMNTGMDIAATSSDVVTLTDNPAGDVLYAGTAGGAVASFGLPTVDLGITVTAQDATVVGGSTTSHTVRVVNNSAASASAVLTFPTLTGPSPLGPSGTQSCPLFRASPSSAPRCGVTVAPGAPLVFTLTWSVPFSFAGPISTRVEMDTEEREFDKSNNKAGADTNSTAAPVLMLPPAAALPSGVCKLKKTPKTRPGRRSLPARCRPVLTFRLTGATTVGIILRQGTRRLSAIKVFGVAGINRITLPPRAIGKGLKRGRYRVDLSTFTLTFKTSAASLAFAAK
jgi:hypothetical protein